jgi:trimeric autotransporter adhesin
VPQNSDNVALRVQRNITKKDRLAFHIGYQRRDGDNSQPFGFLDTTSGSGLATDLGWTRTLSPTLISTTRVTFNRNRSETTPFFANGTDVAQQLGIQGISTNPLNFGPPGLNFSGSGFASLSDGSPVLTRNQSQSGSESVVVVHGTHSFTFGAQYTRGDLNTTTDPNGRGTLNFTGQSTGFDFADFLEGLPQSASIRYGESVYLRQSTWSAYAMDEWKVGPNLTLSLGGRYELFVPLEEKYGHIANLAIGPYFTGVPSLVTPADPGIPAGLINPDYNNFSPRLGLAWKVAKMKRSTVVRLGYGIYYNGQAYIGLARNLAQQPPFATSQNVNSTPTDVLSIATAFTGAKDPSTVTNTYAVDPNYRTPYAQTWSVSVQHDLGAGFFTEIGYLGTKGTRLDVLTTPNQGPPGSGFGSQIYTYDSSVGDSIYHALQARLQRRFRHGISMQALYTFSKSIDDSSTFGGAGNTVAQNWLDLAAERGLSSFDRRHVLTMSWVLTSPFGTDGSRVAPGTFGGRLLKDWQLTGGLTAETGTPLTARLGGSNLGLAATGGVGSGRAEATGESISAGSGFFNTGAFTNVLPSGEFGDAGRNTIPGPGMASLNLGVGRSVQLGDSRRRLELRMEANNVLNHVNYASVYTVVGAGNYGLAAAAGQMRSLSAVLRFRF